MSTQVQYRRGTEAQNNAFTGALAEITVDTTNWSLRVHDGVTAGGTAMVSVAGTQTLTNKTLTSPTLTTPSITSAVIISGVTNGNANGVGNIGNATGYFNTVFAKATSAQYADVAEKYVADHFYGPGTVVEIGGIKEVTETTSTASPKIAGVVSTDPALIMNSGEQAETAVAVALIGRVPCKVVGQITKGSLLCSSDTPGHAQSLPIDLYVPGVVIGKALENHESDGPGVIEILVGRL